jgi:hypothetical protein
MHMDLYWVEIGRWKFDFAWSACGMVITNLLQWFPEHFNQSPRNLSVM